MPNTHGLGRLFWHTQRYPDNAPMQLIAERGNTQEYEEPYRYGRSVLVRIPFTRWAVAFGRWRGTVDEDTALHASVRREIGEEAYLAAQAHTKLDHGDWTVVSHAPEA